MSFAIEVLVCGEWERCTADGEEARFGSRDEAECEARWSLAHPDQWRVVEIEWKCHAKPASLGGLTCGHENGAGIKHFGVVCCESCGATKRASEKRGEGKWKR